MQTWLQKEDRKRKGEIKKKQKKIKKGAKGGKTAEKG